MAVKMIFSFQLPHILKFSYLMILCKASFIFYWKFLSKHKVEFMILVSVYYVFSAKYNA